MACAESTSAAGALSTWVISRMPKKNRSSSGNRRDGRYPARIQFNITADMQASLAAASGRYNVTIAMLARSALARGLPLELAARRKKISPERSRRMGARVPKSTG